MIVYFYMVIISWDENWFKWGRYFLDYYDLLVCGFMGVRFGIRGIL